MSAVQVGDVLTQDSPEPPNDTIVIDSHEQVDAWRGDGGLWYSTDPGLAPRPWSELLSAYGRVTVVHVGDGLSSFTVVPEAVAQQVALLRDLPAADLAAVAEIEEAADTVRCSPSAVEVREALVALVAAGLYLLEVDRG